MTLVALMVSSFLWGEMVVLMMPPKKQRSLMTYTVTVVGPTHLYATL